MLLRVMKTLLRAMPLLLGLVFTIYLILIHGSRLAVDGNVPLAGLGVRMLLCGVLVLVALIYAWLRRRGTKPDEQEPASSAAPLDESSERELALRERLSAWRQRTGGKLPGFLLMGPAGVNKGPLLGLPANADEDLRCSAVGGFAVFVVGGKLVSPCQPHEARLWRRLLDELGQSGASGVHPRGIILVLSAARLQSATEGERDQIALTLRVRLEELASRFGNALTVQLIITECERLPGYSESLACLPANRRELSVEFAPATSNRQLLASLGQRMCELVEGLDSNGFERLQREPDVQLRARLYGFIPMWREFAVTLQSALSVALAQEPGIAQVALQSVRFSAHPATLDTPAPALLRAMQTCRRPGRLRTPLRQTCAWWQPRVHYLAVVASLLAGLLVLNLYRDQDRRLDQVDRHIAALQPSAGPGSPATQGTRALPGLDQFGDIARLLNQRWMPWMTDRQLRQLSEQLYTQQLRQVLLVDVLQRLQSNLHSSTAIDDEALRHNLGLYLMLGGEVPMDARAIRDWYARAAQGQGDAQRLRLDNHLQRLIKLLAQSDPLPLNQALIEQVRHRLAERPLAQRLYEQLLEKVQDNTLAEFSIASVLGAQGMLLFARRSGESLVDGVPGAYTQEGNRRLETLIEPLLMIKLSQERRLMGYPQALTAVPVKREILALYHQDYIAHWEDFFDDLHIAGLDQHEHLPRRLVQLAQPDSPLVELLLAATRHTELAPALVPEGWREHAQKQVQRLHSAAPYSETTPAPVLHPVARHFQPLHRWLTASAPAPQAQSLLGAVKGAALLMQANQQAASLGVAVPPHDAMQRLQEQIEQLPHLLQPMFMDIADVGRQQMQQRAQHTLENAWAVDVVPVCERVLDGRYPFTRNANNDVALEDFNQLFAGDGVFQRFVAQHLAGQLDTGSRPWRVNQTYAGEAIDASIMLALEQAARLREGFFPVGQAQAYVEFELSPVTMSERIASFTLSVDGRRLDYRHGPLRPAVFEFPGKALGTEIRATVTLLDGRTLTLRTEGAWAWLRLLDQVNQVPTQDPHVQHLVMDFEGEKVRLQLRTARSDTPFNRDALSRIRCA